jgi:hypothetical protein
VLWCERWCLCGFFGVYGKKGIIGALRTWRGRWRTFYPQTVTHLLPLSSNDDFLARFSYYS